jgi:Tfp pilus assembly protein PilF
MISSLSLILNSARHCLSSLILIVVATMAVNGQAPGSSRGLTSGDGNHIIQGRVFFPAGQTVASKVVKVTLESTNSVGGQSTSSDEDGTFRFNGLRSGNYNVIVEGGKEYESVREPVSIDPSGTSSAAIQVNIQLRPRVDPSNPAFAGVPQPALDLYQKGMTAAQKNNAKGAVEFLTQALAAYPNFSLALSELGVQYLKLKQMDKAADTYQTLIKLKPDDANAQLNLGIALFNLNKIDDAEVHLREAVKLNAPGPSAHYYLGVTLIKLKQNEEAQKEMELAISNGGDNLPLAHRFLGGLYWSARRYAEAANEFEKYLSLDPKVAEADTIKKTIKDLRSKQ